VSDLTGSAIPFAGNGDDFSSFYVVLFARPTHCAPWSAAGYLCVEVSPDVWPWVAPTDYVSFTERAYLNPNLNPLVCAPPVRPPPGLLTTPLMLHFW
jgi:hypothetical protein